MRCLHCNKKLSLLKLAKGDSYCSPEHFDAHQLQLSKSAIERLMSAPAEEAPKRPLVITAREEEPVEPAPRRVADIRPASVPAKALPAAPVAIKEPPPAPFAISPLPLHLPEPAAPVASEPDEPAVAARELSFPVHEWEATTGLLNLYVRVGLSEATPMNWTSPRNFVLAAETFPRDVMRGQAPTLQALDPRPFRELEELVPEDSASPGELAPPVEATTSIEEDSAESLLPLLVEELVPEDSASPGELAPPVEATTSIEEDSAESHLPLLVEELVPEDFPSPVGLAQLIEATTSIVRSPSVEPEESTGPRLPFLIAPSFQERTALPIALDPASSIPNPAMLAPVLDTAPGRSDSPGAMARLTLFAEAASLQVQNPTVDRIPGTAELPFATALVLPAPGKEGDRDRWHRSNPLIRISSTILETAWQATYPPDFAPPADAVLLVRPAIEGVRRLDPAECLKGHARVYRAISPVPGNLVSPSEAPRPESASTPPIALATQQPDKRAIKTASIFLGPLETRPLRQKAVFRDPSVSASEFGWRAVLAKTPLTEPLSTATWHRRVHCPLPVSIADGPAWSTVPMQLLPYAPACIQQGPAQLHPPSLAGRPYHAIAWRSIDPAVPRQQPPSPFAALPELRFSRVDRTSTSTELLTSGAELLALPGPFAVVSNTVFSQPDLCFMTPTNLPQSTGSNSAGFGTVPLCTPLARWEPLHSAARNPAAVKFLPLREDPILPSASGWARLRSLPR